VWSRSAINPTIVRSHRTQRKTVLLSTERARTCARARILLHAHSCQVLPDGAGMRLRPNDEVRFGRTYFHVVQIEAD
jgi:hypothetical protein